ncbi:MAG: Jag N-terminal domain-containing protein [Anaerolineae bacterium]|nr:Jag N-terminal domain-containing protein [Anaerolineae bacterium]
MELQEWVEITAPTEEEAIIIGLTRLGISREQADIEVLDKGSKGFLGIGSREARVRVSVCATPVKSSESTVVKPAPYQEVQQKAPVVAPANEPEEAQPVAVDVSQAVILTPEKEAPPAQASVDVAPVYEQKSEPPQPELRPKEPPQAPQPKVKEPDKAREDSVSRKRVGPSGNGRSDVLEVEAIEAAAIEVSEHLFEGLRIQSTVSWGEEERPTLWLSLRGGDADALVGPRAQTLDAVQYLMRTLVHRQVDGNYNLVVDADGYRHRRQRSLVSMARKMANRAIKTGKSVRLRPMPAHERRIIHMTLREDARVTTQSRGSGRNRAVFIAPRDRSSR